MRIIEVIINDEQIYNVNEDTLLNLFEVFECCLMKKMVFISTRKQLMRIVPCLLEASKYTLNANVLSDGLGLMQHITKNKEFLLLSRPKALFSSYKDRDKKWINEDIGSVHYIFDYVRDDMYYFQNYEENNVYEISLLNAINRSPIISKDEREIIIFTRFELDIIIEVIEVLAETNLELLSRNVLTLMNNSNFNTSKIEKIIDVFLKSCLTQIENNDMIFWEFGTIINVIYIARSVQAEWFLSKIRDVLYSQIIDRSPKLFWEIICLYPKFVADLIDVLPELFRNVPLIIFDSPCIINLG